MTAADRARYDAILERVRRDAGLPEVIPGGCPCGWWSGACCAYCRATHNCRTPREDRP